MIQKSRANSMNKSCQVTSAEVVVHLAAEEAEIAAANYVNALATFIGQTRTIRHLTADSSPLGEVLRATIAVPPAREGLASASEGFDRARKELRRAMITLGVEQGESVSEMGRLLGLSKQYAQRLHSGLE